MNARCRLSWIGLLAFCCACGGSGGPGLATLDPGPGAGDLGTASDSAGPGDDPGRAADDGALPDLPADPGPEAGCATSGQCALGHLCVAGGCVPGCESDRDCPADRRCRPDRGDHGTCAECLGDGDCPQGGRCVVDRCVFLCLVDGDCAPGLACVGNACRTGNCAKDGDCVAGEYCHPALATCMKLPGGACTQDKDCHSLPFAVYACDPLTRTCIQPCTSGVCFGLPMQCDDGLCYECLTDAQCPGTKCRAFDRTCGKCKTDADCKDPSCPVCGKSNACLGPCTDECLAGQTACDVADTTAPIGFRACGDVDDDPCREYGPAASCGGRKSCSQGACRCVDECQAGESQCIDATHVRRCSKDADGCLYWEDLKCDTTTVCRTTKCECEVSCSQTAKRCIEGDPSHFEVCVPNSFTGCMYWALRNCHQGTTCVGAQTCDY